MNESPPPGWKPTRVFIEADETVPSETHCYRPYLEGPYSNEQAWALVRQEARDVIDEATAGLRAERDEARQQYNDAHVQACRLHGEITEARALLRRLVAQVQEQAKPYCRCEWCRGVEAILADVPASLLAEASQTESRKQDRA